MRYVDQIELAGKKVLLRADYNVPLKDAEVTDDLRIRESLPTLRYIMEKGGALVVCSHLGRPKGERNLKYSLAPVARHLGKLLGREIALAPDCIGPEVEKLVSNLRGGDILLLENLRFHKGEEKNDPEFSAELAKGYDVYVDDAFGVAHRAQSSVVGVLEYIPVCCAGFLMKKEWEYLSKALKSPERPLGTASGGSKVSTKVEVLNNLLGVVDRLFIGGAMANTFLKAQGYNVGASLVEDDLLEQALGILKAAEKHQAKVFLPVDFVYSLDKGDILQMKKSGICSLKDVPNEAVLLDIGPATVGEFAKELAECKTIIWNGPMGAFENPDFASGSIDLGQAMVASGAITIAGGGDTDAVLHLAGLAEKFDFISTGGGSFMEFMEGKELPAFKALREHS